MKKTLAFLFVLVLASGFLFAQSFVDDRCGYLSEEEKAYIEEYYDAIEGYYGISVGAHSFVGSDDESENDAYMEAYVEQYFDEEDAFGVYFQYLQGEEDYYCVYLNGDWYSNVEAAFDSIFAELEALGSEASAVEMLSVFGDSLIALGGDFSQTEEPTTEAQFVRDEVGLLTKEELQRLDQNLRSYSTELGYPILVATATSVKGLNTIDDSDLLLEDYVGINQNGVMLYINMGNREWNITTSGAAIRELNDRTLERLEGDFLSDLSKGEYYKAFDSFALKAKNYALNERNRSSVPVEEEGFDWAFFVFVGLTIGIIAASISTSVMKKKLKSAVLINNANDFVKPGSFSLSNRSDIFLYRNVSKVKIEKNSSSSSTHHSSSGGSHGGRSGHF